MPLRPSSRFAITLAAPAVVVLALPSCSGRVETIDTTGGTASSIAGSASSTAAAGDASVGAPGVNGTTQATPPSPGSTGAVGPGSGSGAVAGSACWESQLPQAVQPTLPTHSVATTCKASASAATWPGPFVTFDAGDGDARAAIVGRWATCGSAGSFSPTPHAGIEFGANGRWRLLVADASGALVPMGAATTQNQGRYYLLSTGQLNLHDDGFNWGNTLFLELVDAANGLTASGGSGPSASYARAQPSPANGSDNAPSTSDGTCSMVGTWDLAATASSPAASFSFDEAGNFVGGPLGSDLCTSHTMYGTYRLSPGMFQLTENIGMGGCAWWFDAGMMPAVFGASCNQVHLTQDWDNCTGGRGYFNGNTVMTRRQ
ncbi:MAG: hypothetical protein ACRENE_05395 [Polyangiaceae bacterium]